MEEYLKDVFNKFSNLKVLIIGDVMIDSYLWGSVDRISPEAPVPIVAVKKRENRLGGAANVALNAKSLGAKPFLCSIVGQDDKSSIFYELMDKENLDTSGMIKSPHRLTTTKFRVIGNNNQMLRVDEESLIDLQNNEMTQLTKAVKLIVEKEKIDVIIFEDYDKGVISHELILAVTNLANDQGIPVVVDPKKNNFLFYRNVDIFKPNLKELEEGLNIEIDKNDKSAIEDSIIKLFEKINAKNILLTLSDKGMVFASNKSKTEDYSFKWMPAHARLASDVSGAGDTVVSVVALCAAVNMDYELLTKLSNLAGGIVCEEVGVVPIDKNKLLKKAIENII